MVNPALTSSSWTFSPGIFASSSRFAAEVLRRYGFILIEVSKHGLEPRAGGREAVVGNVF